MALTKKKLREHMLRALPNKKLIIVSNREPYVHTMKNGALKYFRPAGGAANALDAVARAGGGIWFAHGSGDADKKVTDKSGKVAVPPDNPEYTLKRIWLNKEEEDGYYRIHVTLHFGEQLEGDNKFIIGFHSRKLNLNDAFDEYDMLTKN